ncbi:MAG TPA: GyrI-like domain-containing protein [Chitinophagaceae bacterium]
MKKVLTGIVIVAVLFIACIYLFVPRQIDILESKKIASPSNATERFLTQQAAWNKWWPENGSNPLSYKDIKFTLVNPDLTVKSVMLEYNDTKIPSVLTILPSSKDSTLLTWKCSINSSSNPFRRINDYNHSKKVRSALRGLMDQLQSFMEKQENVYGMTITQQQVQDTLLVTTRATYDHYPATSEIYSLVNKLNDFIKNNKAIPTNPPMLNVQSLDNRYEVMVAIPLNVPVQDKNEVALKRMVPGKILVAEVKGGPETVNEAFRQMELFANDYKKSAPAIPFFSLITDRINERDTSKWITRIYYPIL